MGSRARNSSTDSNHTFLVCTPLFLWDVSDGTEHGWLAEAGVHEDLNVDDDIGFPPPWIHYECHEAGWESLMGIERHFGFWSMIDWGLREGIAPGQPFLVDITPPRYVSFETDCGTEHDVEIEVEIVEIAPISPEAAKAVWEEAFTSTLQEVEALALDAAQRDHQLRYNTKEMRLRISDYYGHNQRYWNDGSYKGWYVALEGRSDRREGHPYHISIVTGRSDEGDIGKAIEDLVRHAAIKLPHLDPAFIRKLPRKHGA